LGTLTGFPSQQIARRLPVLKPDSGGLFLYQSASTVPPVNCVLFGVYWWISKALPSGSLSQI
jgi:hypothetical protein